MEKIDFTNIYLKYSNDVVVNQYFKFERKICNSKEYVTLIYNNLGKNTFESSITIFISALKITFPEIHIYPVSDKKDGLVNSMRSYIIDYYVDENDSKDIVKYKKIELTEEKYLRLEHIFNLLCNRNRKNYIDRNNGNEKYKFNPWHVAYNSYLSACSANSVDGGIVNLISGLESLVSNEKDGLTQKVSMRTAVLSSKDIEIRKDIYFFVKQMYDIRSLIVHGDPNQLLKNRYKEFFEDSYHSYFKLKEILSNILVILHNMNDKNTMIKQIRNKIIEAQLKCEEIEIT